MIGVPLFGEKSVAEKRRKGAQVEGSSGCVWWWVSNHMNFWTSVVQLFESWKNHQFQFFKYSKMGEALVSVPWKKFRLKEP
jgi:hypothetical protein